MAAMSVGQRQSQSYLGLSSVYPTSTTSPQPRMSYSPAGSPPSLSPPMPQLHFSPASAPSFASVRSISPYMSFADRDIETQRRLLGDDAFASHPASPSHHFRPTSPLSEASNLEDELDIELVDSDRSPAFGRPALSRNFSTTDQSEDELYTPPVSALGLAFSAPSKSPAPIIIEELRSARTRNASPLLPTIRETTWPYGGTLFPHAPPPPPPEPFKPREPASPHIVDIAIETYGIPHREPLVMYVPPSPPSQTQRRRRKTWNLFRKSPSSPQPSEEKLPDVWSVWDAERLRAAEMTREAAKDNYPEWRYQDEVFTSASPQEQDRTSLSEERNASVTAFSRLSSRRQSMDESSTTCKGSRIMSSAAARIRILSRSREHR